MTIMHHEWDIREEIKELRKMRDTFKPNTKGWKRWDICIIMLKWVLGE
jgi:hypothetical protein